MYSTVYRSRRSIRTIAVARRPNMRWFLLLFLCTDSALAAAAAADGKQQGDDDGEYLIGIASYDMYVR